MGVVKTAVPIPRRAEAHHIAAKADKAVRYDVRNGITLAKENHEKVEANVLEIIGTKWFVLGGKRYIDATAAVIFRVKERKK